MFVLNPAFTLSCYPTVIFNIFADDGCVAEGFLTILLDCAFTMYVYTHNMIITFYFLLNVSILTTKIFFLTFLNFL